MKTQTWLFASILYAVGAPSCSDKSQQEGFETQMEETQKEEPQMVELSPEANVVIEGIVNGSYKRDLCAIEEIADNIPFSEGNKSRRFIVEMKPILSEARGGFKAGNKSGGYAFPDTIAYLVNFSDDMGSALVPVDIRVPDEVLFFCEDGNVTDSVGATGFSLFMEMAVDYIQHSVEEAQLREDSIKNALCDILNLESIEDLVDVSGSNKAGRYLTRTTRIVQQVRPLSVVEWGQRHNEYTKSRGCNGDAPYTGCVPTSSAGWCKALEMETPPIQGVSQQL